MMARLQKSIQEKDNDKGFTLVELLVVIIIIGILSAIAVPVYLNQQAKAKDSAAKADLGNLKVAVASYLVDKPDATSIPLADLDWKKTEGVENVTDPITINGGAFTISATSAADNTFVTDETGGITKAGEDAGGSGD